MRYIILCFLSGIKWNFEVNTQADINVIDANTIMASIGFAIFHILNIIFHSLCTSLIAYYMVDHLMVDAFVGFELMERAFYLILSITDETCSNKYIYICSLLP